MSTAVSTSEECSNSSSTVYVGNLDQRVTDAALQELFSTIGTVNSVKIITVRRNGNAHAAVNYGFVEFADYQAAEQALRELNGHKLLNHEIKLNWAQQGGVVKDESAKHFQIFVGDLAPEITDEMLTNAFTAFGTLSGAHVMWDSVSGKSRGFGFVAFRDKTDAEKAIATMNGEWLGSRAIRCNWATQKSQSATPAPQPGQQLPYEVVLSQTPAYVTSVYVGNLAPETTQDELAVIFRQLGYIHEVKLQAERGFAFVKMDSHENAANAIVQLQNYSIHGRPAKLSWGKDRPPAGWQSHSSGYNHRTWDHGHMDHHQSNNLYPGNSRHGNRAGGNNGYNNHPQSNPMMNSHAFALAAPNSLASLDPHAAGTQATNSSSTLTPQSTAAQWNQ